MFDTDTRRIVLQGYCMECLPWMLPQVFERDAVWSIEKEWWIGCLTGMLEEIHAGMLD